MSWSTSGALRFLAGGCLTFAALYALSEVVDPVAPVLRARVALFRTAAPHVEAVGVGNSHGAVIRFPELGMRGMHFAMAGEDGFEAAHLARFATRAPRLRYVFYAVSYGVPRKDHAVVTSSDLRARRREIYARIPFERPLPGDSKLWVGGVIAPVVRDDHWKRVVGRPFRAPPRVRLTADGAPAGLVDAPPLPAERLESYGADAAREQTRLGVEMMVADSTIPARMGATLDALARDLRARGVTLVLYTPPYHGSYLRALDRTVNAETDALMARLTAAHPNALRLDYSADPRFTGRRELFTNSDHLNQKGGAAFSRLLAECLSSARAGRGTGPGIAGCPARLRI